MPVAVAAVVCSVPAPHRRARDASVSDCRSRVRTGLWRKRRRKRPDASVRTVEGCNAAAQNSSRCTKGSSGESRRKRSKRWRRVWKGRGHGEGRVPVRVLLVVVVGSAESSFKRRVPLSERRNCTRFCTSEAICAGQCVTHHRITAHSTTTPQHHHIHTTPHHTTHITITPHSRSHHIVYPEQGWAHDCCTRLE